MYKAKKIILPNNGILTESEFLKVKTRLRNSAKFYATELRKSKKVIAERLALKGIPSEGIKVQLNDGSIVLHDVISEVIAELVESGVISDVNTLRAKISELFYQGKSEQYIRMKLKFEKFGPRAIDVLVKRFVKDNQLLLNSEFNNFAERIVSSYKFDKLENGFEKRNYFWRKMKNKMFPSDKISKWINDNPVHFR